MTAISTVGILGLGKMGAPMAGHLLARGYSVAGYDPLEPARRAARALGVSVRESPREVARASELVIVVGVRGWRTRGDHAGSQRGRGDAGVGDLSTRHGRAP